MPSTDQTRGEFGSLERWTIALFALSFFVPLLLELAALICLVMSKFWTVGEKLIAVFVPILLGAAAALIGFALFEGSQDWVRIPVMLSFSLIGHFGSAIYLYVIGRSARTVGIGSPA